MLNQRSAIDLATSFIHQIEQKDLHIKKVYLYGSFAKNMQHELSDIDIAIIADEFIGSMLIDGELFKEIHVKKPFYLIQPKTYNTSYFEKGDAFIDEIKKTGIELNIN